MATYPHQDWHTASGRALPFRPPTVDEAFPYSPFTSIVPFSPDVIPFPINDPPTPPTTLTPDQQAAGRKAVAILNEEIKGPASTARHLEHTLRELRGLLGNACEMTEFHFKSTPQLATPPPESPLRSGNETAPSDRPRLSPFASALLNQTDVHYQPAPNPIPQPPIPQATVPKPKPKPEPPRRPASTTTTNPSTPSQLNAASYAQNSALTHLASTPVRSSQSSQSRSGPAVVIKPSTAPKHEFKLIDNVPPSPDEIVPSTQEHLATLQPEDRAYAEQKIEQLHKLVARYCEAKDELESEYFERISTIDADITVMTEDALKKLYDKVMAVYATKCFPSVSVEVIIQIQSLCDPLIAASDQSSLLAEGDFDSWAGDIRTLESGLKAAKVALTAMLEGPSDRRTSSEDLLTTIVQAVKRALELCVFPVLTSSRGGSDAGTFDYASNHKPEMSAILRLCTSIEELSARIVRKITLPDSVMNAIEFLALALLVHPNSTSEKDSILGIQQFERIRRAAMDVLTNIFASRPDHQQYIVNEILNSLEKLPDKGSNTRQFKSVREEPIMTVSAIFMQFVQVAGTHLDNRHTKSDLASEDEGSSENDSEANNDSDHSPSRKVKTNKSSKKEEEKARRLMINALQIAQIIASTLIEKAKGVAKSADKPYRNLLDMFVDDFCRVLGSPEWPAAHLLLLRLFYQLWPLLETSNWKMAMSVLGYMGCGIIDFKTRLRKLRQDVDMSQSDISTKLHRLTEEVLENDGTRLKKNDLLALTDPFRMVIGSLPDYLKVNDNRDDIHLLSVRGCYASNWLDSINQVMESNEDDAASDKSMIELRRTARSIMLESNWSSREYKYQNVSETQSRLAAGVTTLKSTFCQHYSSIVSVMFKHAQEGGAAQKTDAIRNIDSFLDKDPRAVSKKHIEVVVHKLQDNSPSVRASALSLISKCLDFFPGLDRLCLSAVLSLTTDSHNDPKKRAIGVLKMMYTRTEVLDTKIQIVAAMLPASQDLEKPVADMATQALEEVWLKVLGIHTKGDENRLKLQRIERVSLIVQTVRQIQKTPSSMQAFEAFFAKALVKSSPNAVVNFQICKDLVADLVEGVISPDDMGANYTQDSALHTLSVFARISPVMFTLEHIQRLKLYVIDPKTAHDIEILRSTVTIYRFVMPCLPDLPTIFADDVWKLLSEAIGKLARSAATGNIVGKSTLLGVINCLWIMRKVATNGAGKMLSVVASTLIQLAQAAEQIYDVSTQEAQKIRIRSWLLILGTFGKVSDWSEYAIQFNSTVQLLARKKPGSEAKLKDWLEKSNHAPSVVLLAAVLPFNNKTWDLAIREAALCALAEVCQGSPALFQHKNVRNTFETVFSNDVVSLKHIAVSQFYDFLAKSEEQSDTTPANEDSTNSGKGLGLAFEAREGQVVASHLAQAYLPRIIDMALKSDDELALVATRTIISINRQGLVHPKQVGTALIALGSSSNPSISDIAANEHGDIHSKHETMFEKEYMVAIKMAFQYQRDVFNDPHGMTTPPDCRPKIAHVFNAMKNGSRKTLKRFIDNLPKLIDFKLSKLGDSTKSLETLLFARFCLENLALFDVAKIEDVSIMTTALESIVLKNTGPSVAVAIETEMPKKAASAAPQQLPPAINAAIDLPAFEFTMQDTPRDDHVSVSDVRLLQITHACMILQMMWEARCFIRKAYNIKAGRISHKKYPENALRNNLIKGTDLWEKFAQIFTALETRQSMIAQCYEFAELMEVDRDFQIAGEQEEDTEAAGYVTPDDNEEAGQSAVTSGRRRKRKSSVSLAHTPKKARGRPKGGAIKKRSSKTPDGDNWE